MVMRGRQVVIYGEYLFLENFITGGILLFFTVKLLNRRFSRIRLFIGAAMCGAAGFAIFLPVAGIAGILMQVGIAASAVFLGLGAKTAKELLVQTAIFMALTLISGGGVMALMLWQEIPSVSGAGALYIPPLTYLRLICFGILAFGFSYLIVKLIQQVRLNIGLCDEAAIRIEGQTILLRAMIDTGNYLKEPISGRSVALIGKNAAGKLEKLKCKERYALIPFHSVGSRNGLLEGMRTDSIYYRGNEVRNAVIAFYENDFEDIDMILGRDFLDRGLSNE